MLAHRQRLWWLHVLLVSHSATSALTQEENKSEPEVFKLSPAVSLSLQHSANLHTAPGYHNQKNDLHEQLEEVQVLQCCDGITHITNYDADYY